MAERCPEKRRAIYILLGSFVGFPTPDLVLQVLHDPVPPLILRSLRGLKNRGVEETMKFWAGFEVSCSRWFWDFSCGAQKMYTGGSNRKIGKTLDPSTTFGFSGKPPTVIFISYRRPRERPKRYRKRARKKASSETAHMSFLQFVGSW